MILAVLALLAGLALLVWSADKFVDGASATAAHFGMPPLLIGMVVVGFGTSAPEMVVSVMAALEGNTGIALGNAYGSNIVNIALILGVTALIAPIVVHSNVIRKELPILLAVTALAIAQIWDGELSRADAVVLLLVFAAYMGWSIWQGMRNKDDALSQEMSAEVAAHAMPLKKALLLLSFGLVLLIISSRILVWGAVYLAQSFGVSDLIIGLTVVAVGTSLPELASSIAAARKGELDIAIGNIIGSNLFNTLAVVGMAGIISPMVNLQPELLQRDMLVMAILTVSLMLFALGRHGAGTIGRVKGAVWVSCFVAYTGYLIATSLV